MVDAGDEEAVRGAFAGGAPSAGRLLGGEQRLERALARWMADASVDEAARARARARWLQVQAEESATLLGTLVGLAERGAAVVLELTGHRVRGTVSGVGVDFVAVQADAGRSVLVPTAAIAVARAEPGGDDVVGDRSPVLDLTLGAVLRPVAADRPTVLVRTTTGAPIRGELRAAGTDVVRLRVEGDPPATVWVALAAVVSIVLEP